VKNITDKKVATWIVLVTVVFLLGVGCDLFRTRSVEPPPNTGGQFFYPDPIQPDQVFLNLKNSLLDLNSQKYLNCFVPPGDSAGAYQFVPDPTVTGWPLTGPWGYAEENQTIGELFSWLSPGAVPMLTLTELSSITYGNDDSVKIGQTYTLTAPTVNTNWPQQVRGQADFIMTKTQTGFWAIRRCTDLHGMEGFPSWTVLKAGLYAP
jgi:hypothetical protein